MNHFSDSFYHCLNPLHIFCRLVDIGISRKYALKIARIYEALIYSHLFKEV